MNSNFNLPPGMSARELSPAVCPDCGSKLGCDCFWENDTADNMQKNSDQPYKELLSEQT